MSLSTCAWCGGNIPLGDPDVPPCCVKCGKHLFSEPPRRTQERIVLWLCRFAMAAMVGYVGFHDWQLGVISACTAGVGYVLGGLDVMRLRNRR